MDDTIRLANSAIIVAIQIEHIDAVGVIEKIVAVPGIDVVALGPMDLSASMGLLGQLQHPDVMAAMERVVGVAQAAGIPAAMPLPSDATADDVLYWYERGCRFIIGGLDQGYLAQGARDNLTELRAHVLAQHP
jgi:2-keto-3-deoxy-L-rhamnonate aldolase RhmA